MFKEEEEAQMLLDELTKVILSFGMHAQSASTTSAFNTDASLPYNHEFREPYCEAKGQNLTGKELSASLTH
ncbi:hypothetical protein T265_05034 [Opisthorchis viverrini]|uniref:Uncharacterized protein n=1 Tax=Opisthorchis viverrini TaxID=6198 RepID=A0A074ZL20_OPIVI|nr:hypothetical protein T265_05034 [Opisthorchis viverrini]KER28053.1 hypothetical protein T265_05034 [Opisthorchis viverrini]